MTESNCNGLLSFVVGMALGMTFYFVVLPQIIKKFSRKKRP